MCFFDRKRAIKGEMTNLRAKKESILVKIYHLQIVIYATFNNTPKNSGKYQVAHNKVPAPLITLIGKRYT